MSDVRSAIVGVLLTLPLAVPATIVGWRLDRWVHNRAHRALRRWLKVPADTKEEATDEM